MPDFKPTIAAPLSPEEEARWPADHTEWKERWKALGLTLARTAHVLGHSEGQQQKLAYGERDLRRYHIIPLLYYEEHPDRLE